MYVSGAYLLIGISNLTIVLPIGFGLLKTEWLLILNVSKIEKIILTRIMVKSNRIMQHNYIVYFQCSFRSNQYLHWLLELSLLSDCWNCMTYIIIFFSNIFLYLWFRNFLTLWIWLFENEYQMHIWMKSISMW